MPDGTSSSLSQVKISELPVAGAVNDTDQLEANQAGTSRSITVGQVKAAAVAAVPSPPTTLPPSGAAGGDLAGSYPNPTLKPGLVPLSVMQFGAKGDGIADDGAALTAWLAALSPTKAGYLPAGTYNTSVPLVKTGNNISIVGDGGRMSTIMYVGASTTADIFTIGDGVGQPKGWTLRGFRVSSNTVMTGGTGIRMRGFCRSDMSDIVADGQDGTGNLWNGFWFNQVDQITLRGYYARGQNDCLRVDGGVGVAAKADLYLCQGKISNGTVGIRMGGGFGGLLIDQTDCLSNGTDLVIDTTLAAETNRELIVGSTVAFDGNTVNCIRFSDLLATGGNLFSFIGTWIASSAGPNILIDSGFAGTIRFQGCFIYNAGRGTNPNCDGILNNSSTATVDVDNCHFRSNSGYGVNATVLNNNLRVMFPKFVSNTVGTFNAAFVRSVIGYSPGLGIGGVGGGDRAVTIQAPATSATTMYGIRNLQQVQSDVTAGFNANATAPAVLDAAFTLTALRHYYASQGTFGPTATVTNQYGFAADATLISAANNYAFYSSLSQGSGRWNAYMAGSAQNYFAGATLVAGPFNYYPDSGTGNAYAVTLSVNPVGTLVAGFQLVFKATAANTGASTLNVNAVGTKAIVKGVSTALAANDILANMLCTVVFDGTSYVLMNPRTL